MEKYIIKARLKYIIVQRSDVSIHHYKINIFFATMTYLLFFFFENEQKSVADQVFYWKKGFQNVSFSKR